MTQAQPPTPPEPNPPAPTPPEPTPPQPGEWHAGLSDEVKASSTYEKFKGSSSIAEYANQVTAAHANAEKKLSQKGIAVPAEGAPASAVREMFTNLGCPESADKYGRSTEGLPEGATVDPEFENAMAEACWGIGVAEPQWQRLRGAIVAYETEQNAQMKSQFETFMADAEKEMRTEWGQSYDEHVVLSDEALSYVFGKDADTVAQIMVDGKPLGSHPIFLRAFGNLGSQLSEADILKGGTPKLGTLTPQNAKSEWARLSSDPTFSAALMDKGNPGHRAAVEKRTELYKLMHPGEQTAKGAYAGGST